MRQRRDKEEKVLLLATREQQNVNIKITKLGKISTTVSDELAATHLQDSDTDNDETDKDEAATDDSAKTMYRQ